MNNKKNDFKERLIKGIIGIVFLIIGVPIIVFFVFHLFNTSFINMNATLKHTASEFTGEVAIITVVIYLLLLLYTGNMFLMRKPRKTEQLASSRWLTDNEMKNTFATAPIDPFARIDVGGIPISKISETELLYDTDVNQDLTIATTRGGKSRKIVSLLIFLIAMARESMLLNDPKKELYKMFKRFLTKIGYKVYCLDFRFLQYSNCKNPMDRVINFFKEDDVDEADQAAQDLVESLVKDNGTTEPIWIDGQKALVKAIMLAVAQANIPENKKNFYSVYQTLAIRGEERAFNGNAKNKKMELTAYIDYLAEDNVSRMAYAPIKNAPEKTRGSFMTSTLATLRLFSNRKLNKVIGKSDFQFKDFAEDKIALFIVNPDEKSTFDSIASIIYDQSYQEFVEVANRNGGSVNKRIHNIFDEAGNMAVIKDLDKKLTVSLGRGILYHLFIQSYAQLEKLYKNDGKKSIVDNTITKFFISSGDFETCEDISKRVGEETVWVDSRSGNYSQNANPTGGNISYQQQRRRLIDANELLSSDLRSGKGIILTKTYNYPARVNLPDISQYPAFYKELDDPKEVKEEINQDRELLYAVPRWVVISQNELEGKPNDTTMNMFPGNFANMGRTANTIETIMIDEMYWYWSMRTDLAVQVKKHLLKVIEKGKYTLTRKDLKEYLLSKEFYNFLKDIDIVDEDDSLDTEKELPSDKSTVLKEMLGN